MSTKPITFTPAQQGWIFKQDKVVYIYIFVLVYVHLCFYRWGKIGCTTGSLKRINIEKNMFGSISFQQIAQIY